jgi:polyhydroxybutyrate depolymerase
VRFWNIEPGPTGLYNAQSIITRANDEKFVAEILEDMQKKFSIDEKKIYATGFSNGAMFVHQIGCDISDKFAAIAPVSAPYWSFPSKCNPSRPISVIYFHGISDPCAPYYGGASQCESGISNAGREFPSVNQTIEMWKSKMNCLGSSKITLQEGKVTCETYSCFQNSELTLCTIEDSGHTWPGGKPYSLPGIDVGQVNNDISANEVMWDFFKKHSIK